MNIGPLGKPLVCAGGIGTPDEFAGAIAMGYTGVQLGTRFIASAECSAHTDYKQAIIAAGEQDIVLSEKISGVPVSVIKTPYIRERRYPCGAAGQVDAARAQDQALDAHAVFTAVDLEAETGFPAGHALPGYFPGRQECGGYSCGPASG